ncbi:MAG: RHS repeat domain-containing protein, partial [Planctomycetota bacterium]
SWTTYHTTQCGHECILSVIDSTGQLAERAMYDPYGRVTVYAPDETLIGNAFQSGLPMSWKAHRMETEAPLVYMRNRHYSPGLGRFVSLDRLGVWGDPFNHGSGFTYGASSPVNFLDPLGLQGAQSTGPGTPGRAVVYPDMKVLLQNSEGAFGEVPVQGEGLQAGDELDLGALGLKSPEDVDKLLNSKETLQVPAGARKSQKKGLWPNFLRASKELKEWALHVAANNEWLGALAAHCYGHNDIRDEQLGNGIKGIFVGFAVGGIVHILGGGLRMFPGGAARGAARSLDDLSAAGRVPDKGGFTRAGRAYQKHMDRGELPEVPGKQLDQAGQDLLDDILTNPETKVHPVTSGRAAGGTRFIRPDGVGATFGADGSLAYFGRYK